VPVVLQTIKDAVSAEEVTKTHNFSPSKDAIDGINYDLTISYDEPTGKYVGVYHCNPCKDERGRLYTGVQRRWSEDRWPARVRLVVRALSSRRPSRRSARRSGPAPR
jgi:hypothetical protein